MNRNLILRISTVMLALVILYVRMPSYFTNPQIWIEDVYFFYRSHSFDWSTTLMMPVAGYFVITQSIVAVLASYFSPVITPAIYDYTAFAFTLIVVWLVTSPRLDLPSRPLLALAVVVVPFGQETLGGLADVQWVLPIGAFVLLFMRTGSPLVLLGESIFVGLTALTGPYSLLLAPLYLVRTLMVTDPPERRRLVILTAIMVVGALLQIWIIQQHPAATNVSVIEPYSWTLWITLPLSKIMMTFGLTPERFYGLTGAVVGIVLFTAALALSVMKPDRAQKIFMLIFGLGIAFFGMLKFRFALETQIPTQRYFYEASICTLWFLCCAFGNVYLRYAATGLVALTEILLLPAIASTPMISSDLNWPVWASYIRSGIPTITPTFPPGWFVSLPASPRGPLAYASSWIGQTITSTGAKNDPSACKGTISDARPVTALQIESFLDNTDLWSARGSLQTAPQLVLLAGADEKIVGFGLLGFKALHGEPEWRSFFHAPGNTALRAYGVVDDGRLICLFGGERSLKHYLVSSISSDKYVSPLQLVPGNDVVQRFKPATRFERLSVRFVTFGRQPSADLIAYKVTASIGGRSVELGAGTINPEDFADWGDADLPLSTIPRPPPDEVVVSLGLAANVSPAKPVGIPLYRPTTQKFPAEIAGKPISGDLQVNIRELYTPNTN